MKGTSPSRASRSVAATGYSVPRWKVRNLINSLEKRKSTAIVTVGIDLAKNIFAVHGVDATGKAALVPPACPDVGLIGRLDATRSAASSRPVERRVGFSTLSYLPLFL